MRSDGPAADVVKIQRLCDRFAAAFGEKDVERIMSVFAPDVVSFDIVPPLWCAGADELRAHWVRTFASYAGPIVCEIHDLDIAVAGDLAVTHSVNWNSGTLTTGQISEQWLRWTTSMRRFEGRWLIVHEHVSVPMNPATGAAVLDLTP